MIGEVIGDWKVVRAIAREPEDRFQTAGELIEALRACPNAPATPARPPALADRTVELAAAAFRDAPPLPPARTLLVKGNVGVLHVVAGPDMGKLYPLPLDVPVVIGRRGEGAAVELDDATASARHCQVRFDGSGFPLEDLGSKNGIWIRSERVKRRVLRDGDAFAIGHTLFRVTLEPGG